MGVAIWAQVPCNPPSSALALHVGGCHGSRVLEADFSRLPLRQGPEALRDYLDGDPVRGPDPGTSEHRPRSTRAAPLTVRSPGLVARIGASAYEPCPK